MKNNQNAFPAHSLVKPAHHQVIALPALIQYLPQSTASANAQKVIMKSLLNASLVSSHAKPAVLLLIALAA